MPQLENALPTGVDVSLFRFRFPEDSRSTRREQNAARVLGLDRGFVHERVCVARVDVHRARSHVGCGLQELLSD